MSVPPMYINTMQYYNGQQRPQTAFVQQAAPIVYQGQPLPSQFAFQPNPNQTTAVSCNIFYGKIFYILIVCLQFHLFFNLGLHRRILFLKIPLNPFKIYLFRQHNSNSKGNSTRGDQKQFQLLIQIQVCISVL